MDAHAQYEIRVYAEAIGLIVQRLAPVAYQAFLDYMREATTLSGPERAIVAKALHGEPVATEDWARIGKRERAEFARKFGLDVPDIPPAAPRATALNGNGHGG
jgi:thymidylate synthase (FAD)